MIALFKNRPIMLSKWNAKAFRPIEDGIVFNVDATQYSGAVEVIYNDADDTFSITLPDINKSIDGVFLDIVITVVDKMVEYNFDDAKSMLVRLQQINIK